MFNFSSSNNNLCHIKSKLDMEKLEYQTAKRLTDSICFEVCYIKPTTSGLISDTGNYIIQISGDCNNNGTNLTNANAIYCLCRSDRTCDGTVVNLCSSRGSRDEMIILKWNKHEYPMIQIECSYKKYLEYTRLKHLDVNLTLKLH